MFKFVKYFSIISLFFVALAFGWCLFIYQNLRYSTPSLSDLAQNLNSFSTAVAFNYSRNIDKQLYLFSKNIGLENNPHTRQEEPKEGDIGANGFFILDVRPGQSKILFHKLDDVLNDALDFLTSSSEASSDNVEKNLILDETENGSSLESPFIAPLAGLLEEIWNGKTFVIAGATQFNLDYKDSFMLALEPYIKNYVQFNSNFFREMVIKNAPIYLQDFLNKHSINVDIEPPITKLDSSIQDSQIILSIDDSAGFLESICSAKINPWDLCGRFLINRTNFRKNALTLLGLVNQDFKVTLNVYWTVRGKDIIYSNQKDIVLKLLDEDNLEKHENVLTEVAASGDDFLFSSHRNLKYTSLSLYFDMIKAQNEGIRFFENMRKNSQVLSDYFSSPRGELAFRNIEKTINEVTSFSQKTSMSFHTDGEKLFPELRLYSPSQDLFINNGNNLSPEFINSLRIFITKAVSFGNYLLPRGLVPVPGPSLKRNGRWVILNSEIPIKSIAPYLESVDPFIDIRDMPSPL